MPGANPSNSEQKQGSDEAAGFEGVARGTVEYLSLTFESTNQRLLQSLIGWEQLLLLSPAS